MLFAFMHVILGVSAAIILVFVIWLVHEILVGPKAAVSGHITRPGDRV